MKFEPGPTDEKPPVNKSEDWNEVVSPQEVCTKFISFIKDKLVSLISGLDVNQVKTFGKENKTLHKLLDELLSDRSIEKLNNYMSIVQTATRISAEEIDYYAWAHDQPKHDDITDDEYLEFRKKLVDEQNRFVASFQENTKIYGPYGALVKEGIGDTVTPERIINGIGAQISRYKSDEVSDENKSMIFLNNPILFAQNCNSEVVPNLFRPGEHGELISFISGILINSEFFDKKIINDVIKFSIHLRSLVAIACALKEKETHPGSRVMFYMGAQHKYWIEEFLKKYGEQYKIIINIPYACHDLEKYYPKFLN